MLGIGSLQSLGLKLRMFLKTPIESLISKDIVILVMCKSKDMQSSTIGTFMICENI